MNYGSWFSSLEVQGAGYDRTGAISLQSGGRVFEARPLLRDNFDGQSLVFRGVLLDETALYFRINHVLTYAVQ